MTDLNQFHVRAVENGWILTIRGNCGDMGRELVFTDLIDLSDWLKEQPEPARKA